MIHTTKSHCELVKAYLDRENLNDTTVTVVEVAEMFEQKIYAVEVTIGENTFVFSPFDLDNGANGIKEDKLVELRNLSGEDLPVAPKPRSGRQKHFTDIIAIDKTEEE